MIFRGAIHEIKALPGRVGHEQEGMRYGIVIQSDQFATSIITVALTSTRAGPAVYRPVIDLDGTKTRVLTDQIHSVAPSRLGAFRGALAPEEAREVDRALILKLGLL